MIGNDRLHKHEYEKSGIRDIKKLMTSRYDAGNRQKERKIIEVQRYGKVIINMSGF